MLVLARYIIVVILLLCLKTYSQETITFKIDSILKDYSALDKPGFSVGVVKNNKVIYAKGFGLSNLDYTIKNTDSTVFSLASISKQFTASAIWSLTQEGKISLEDDIRRYLPEFPDYGTMVKIKHLLNHTAGIRNYHTMMSLAGFDYNNEYYDNDMVLKLACRQKHLNNTPGEKVVYSNTHYNILAIIVERVSKQNLNDYLNSRILKPLNMNETFVRVKHGYSVKNKAVGYQKRGVDYVFNTSNQLSYGAGSMGSTVLDMSIWMTMLNGLIPEFQELSNFLKTTELLHSGEKANYARGVMLDNYKNYTTVGHGGYGFGGQSQLINVPSEGLGVIMLTNLQGINPKPIVYKVLDVLLPEKKTSSYKAKTINKEYNLSDYKNYIGDYKEVNSDMKMAISIENDTLKALGSMGKTATSLIPFKKDKFHRLHSESVKYDFSKRSNYDMVISFGGTPFYFERATFIDSKSVNLEDYIGDFYSEELNVNYHFFIEEQQLKLSYKRNENIKLIPVQLDEFGNNNRTLYKFIKDKKGTVNGLYLSCDGQVSNIEFTKQKSRL